MNEYHKIQTVYKRNPADKFKTLLEGEYSLLEFEYLSRNKWIFTEKVNGTNIRVMFGDFGSMQGVVTFGGKTDRAMIPSELLLCLQGMFVPQTELFKEKFPEGACFYGEGYGAKIQKGGGNYRQDQSFVLFDIKIGPWWLRREDVCAIAKEFGIDVVPVIGEGTLIDMVSLARQGFNSQWGDFLAEGIVARPSVDLKSRNGGRIITKIKHADFRG